MLFVKIKIRTALQFVGLPTIRPEYRVSVANLDLSYFYLKNATSTDKNSFKILLISNLH